MPGFVREHLGRREKSVLSQGFTGRQLQLEWWNARLREEGFAGEPLTVDPNHCGADRLTRQELFTLASKVSDASSDEVVLTLLLHVLAWGSGLSRRNNGVRISSLVASDTRAEHVVLLRAALQYARDGDVAEAYACLIRRGGGAIPGLGPAFFTKYLYFAGAGRPLHPCLILDARVAASLYSAGWETLPRSRSRTGWSYSANWYTATYVGYCQLLSRWAEEESRNASFSVAADEIERALFDGKRAG
jgi:hypothetical protein